MGERVPISRVTRSKSAARANYNRLSRWYDLLAGRSEAPFRNRGLRLLGAQAGERILEIGIGTGAGLVELARSVGPGGQVWGIDISEGMLAVARVRLEKQGLAGRVHLNLADAAAAPLQAQCCDAIFMSFVLELFDTPEIPVVLANCLRALKPAGRICVVALSKEGEPAWPLRLYELGHRAWPTVLDCRPIYAARALQSAGFVINERVLSKMWGLPVESVLAVSPAGPRPDRTQAPS